MYKVTIKPTSVTSSYISVTRKKPNSNSLQNLKKRCNNDDISKKTQKLYGNRMLAYCEMLKYLKITNPQLLKSQKIYTVFLTLTLPKQQKENDYDNKRNLLNNFIIQIQKKYNVENYLWKAEKQKNGNIHYHIMCDKYLPKEEIRHIWEKILITNKYEFSKNNNSKYNTYSTWIVSAKNIDSLQKYMKKYMCKKSENTINGVEGRKMGCSDKLRKIALFSSYDCKITALFVQVFLDLICTKTIEKEYYSIHYIDLREYKNEKEEYRKYIEKQKFKVDNKYRYNTTFNTPLFMKEKTPELFQNVSTYYLNIFKTVYNNVTA